MKPFVRPLILSLAAALLLPMSALAATSEEAEKIYDVEPGQTVTYQQEGRYTSILAKQGLYFSEEAAQLAEEGSLSYSFAADLSCGTSRTFARSIVVECWRIEEAPTPIDVSFILPMGGSYLVDQETYIVPATTFSYASGVIEIPKGTNFISVEVRGQTAGTASDLAVDLSLTLHDPLDETFMVPAYELFSDVEEEDYFCQPVAYAYHHQYMTGVEATRFDPDSTLTRGQFVTTLYRLSGEEAEGSHAFTDVARDSYYEDAVIWACSNDIVNGVSDTSFAPNAAISREQMAAILYRYAQHKELDTTGGSDLTVYTDAHQVSSYAIPSMAWANGQGLILGRDDGTLDPRGETSRGQAATVLYRFCTNGME